MPLFQINELLSKRVLNTPVNTEKSTKDPQVLLHDSYVQICYSRRCMSDFNRAKKFVFLVYFL